jgi:transposase InsO family protein
VDVFDTAGIKAQMQQEATQLAEARSVCLTWAKAALEGFVDAAEEVGTPITSLDMASLAARASGIAKALVSPWRVAIGRLGASVGGPIRDVTVGIGSFVTPTVALCYYRRTWATKARAKIAVGDWIEDRYNRRRRHSALGQVSPVQFDMQYSKQSVALAKAA